jgi:hypothetical protein
VVVMMMMWKAQVRSGREFPTSKRAFGRRLPYPS